MVAQLKTVNHTFAGNGTVYREIIKGPALVYAIIPSRCPTSTAIYFASRYDDTNSEYDFYCSSQTNQYIFAEPVLFPNGLYVALYNNTGGATTVGVCVIFKNLAKLK